MARRKKLFLIITISCIITYFIFILNKDNKINILALGDGISSGETAFKIDGISYNDYIKEYFYNKKILKNYNNSFSYKNYKINDLLNDIKINKSVDNKNIKQLIHKANIITLGIGEEEIVKTGVIEKIELTYLKKIINEYDELLKNVKENTEAKIIIVSFYENKYLSNSDVIVLNSELSNLCKKYDITMINITDLLLNNEYFPNKDSFYFNYKAHEEIAKMIINSI